MIGVDSVDFGRPDDVAGSHEISGICRPRNLRVPHLLSRHRIVAGDGGGDCHARVPLRGDRPIVPRCLRCRSRLDGVANGLDLDRCCVIPAGDIEETRPRTEGGRSEIGSASHARRVDDEVTRQERLERRAHALGELRISDDRIDGAERLLRHAPRRVRNGLGGPRLLARHVSRRRHRHLHDGVQRPARLTVKYVEVTGLRRHRNRLDGPSRNGHIKQHRRGDQVPIPDVMMEHLVMPDQLACRHVQRDDGIREQINPVPYRAVVIR